jgi:dTDP-4-amino-4,6-dideoxygalactose transaminase
MNQIKIPFLELKRNYLKIKEDIDTAVSRVLSSGWYLFGEELEQFEHNFSEYCGVKYGIGVASGTEAIQIALNACGVGQGDDVITTSNTCVPTITGIELTGAKCIFIDIDPETYTINPLQIEERITPKTKAIVVVHLYGLCADMNLINQIAKKYDLKIVEDCAQAHGALYKGQHAGSIGDVGTFSFYPTKNLGAFGDAGMVVTNDKDTAINARMLRNYGQKTKYHHQIKGLNSRMDELQAAILNTKLPFLDQWIHRRQQIADQYISAFKTFGIPLPKSTQHSIHSYHLFVVRLKNRDRFRNNMIQKGVQTDIHYPLPVHQQPAYFAYRVQRKFLPTTESQTNEIVSIPLYPELTNEEVDYIIKSMKSSLVI